MKSVPTLGGQSVTYFVSAMRAYQDDTRGHATMRDVAKAYGDKDLKNFAAHYAQFGSAEGVAAQDIARPPAAASCESCHGLQGRVPVNPESAVLAGQKKSYLMAAIKEYRDGTRKHAVMREAVANLTDPDVEALSDYFSALAGLVVK